MVFLISGNFHIMVGGIICIWQLSTLWWVVFVFVN